MTRHKGYVRLNEDLTHLETWQLPEHDENAKPKATAFSRELKEFKDTQSLDELKMLTAEDLEQIRQTALEEGLKEGRDSGFIRGQEAGFLQGKEQGFAEGKAQGFEKGIEEGQALIKEHSKALETMLAKLSFPLEQINADVEIKIIEIIIEIARAVLKSEIETNPKVIVQTLQNVVASLPMAKRNLTIYLHPEDKKLIESVIDETSLKQYHWTLLAEPNFARGDIQVTCLDSSIHYLMQERIEQALTRFMEKNPIKKVKSDDGSSNVLIIKENITQEPAEMASKQKTEQDEPKGKA